MERGKRGDGYGQPSLYEWLETNVAKSFGERIVWFIMWYSLQSPCLFFPLQNHVAKSFGVIGEESCMVHHNELYTSYVSSSFGLENFRRTYKKISEHIFIIT